MSLRKLFTLLFFLILELHLGFGQKVLPDFEFISIDENFPKRGITAIIEDHQGFIWIGTYGAGLYRYDGISYTSFRYNWQDSTSINSNTINTVYLDQKNNILIGTNIGLNIYNQSLGTFSTIPIEKSIENQPDKLDIVSIIQDANGSILIGSNTYGLFVIPPGEKIAKSVTKEFPLNILNFAVSASGNIYAATNLGLKIYDPEKNTFRTAEVHTEQGILEIKEPITQLLVDKMNNLWIGSQQNGMYKTSCLNAKNPSLKYLENFPISSKRILSIGADKKGNIFCGTENDGLIILDNKGKLEKILQKDKSEWGGIKSNSVWEIYFDQHNRLWLGYYNEGVDLYDPNYRKFNQIIHQSNRPNSISPASLTGIVVDDKDNIWFGQDGGGLNYYDKAKNEFIPFLHERGSDYLYDVPAAIQTIFIDSKENVWAGSWDEGIFLLKKGSQQFINYTIENTGGQLASNRILSICEDRFGTIWIGTFGKGLHSYDPKQDFFSHKNNHLLVSHNLLTSDIRKVIIDQNNQLWVGSTNGLYLLTLDAKQEIKAIVSFRKKWATIEKTHNSLSNILTIYQSKNNDIWVGTDGAGLLRYSIANDSLILYNRTTGLEQETVAAIIEESSGQIWVSGRNGISVLDPTSIGNIKNYSKKDGLISNDFNNNSVAIDSSGVIYFGNVGGGVNYFKPGLIPNNNEDIRVYLTELKLFNKTVLPGEKEGPLTSVIGETKEITLNYLQSVFTIEYTGISLTHSEKNQFAYYLEGLENDWNYVGNKRSATYTSLKSGDYVFHLKAANNDGLWSNQEKTLKIKVLPPWWRSKTGFVIYLLLFLASLYLFFRMMRMRLIAKEERENEQIRRRQEKELNDKKFQFFTNISHEFRTPLTLIINPLEDLLKEKSSDFPDEIHTKHLIIHKNSKRLQRMINELLDFRKLSFNKMKVRAHRTEVVGFVHSVADYFQGEAMDASIDLKVTSTVEKQPVWLDPGLIEKVLFNLLSNAFKVTNAGGKIEISIAVTETILEEIDKTTPQPSISIAVSDTGPGLSPEHVKKIFDRFFQVENLNKAYYGGTGIGLEVVNNFIKLHQGKIEVVSELKKGTIFTFYLPIGQQFFPTIETTEEATKINQQLPKEVLAPISTEEKPITEKKSKTLLIVEDNLELRNYLKSELKKIYQIRTAADGKEGLQMAINTLPDLIISDVMMPKMDGFELCKKIKLDLRTCHIPVLMLTAKRGDYNEITGIDSGADAYMGKPFDMVLLKSKLNQLLTSRQIIFNKYFNGISESRISKNTTELDRDFIQKMLKLIHARIGDTHLNVETLAAEVFLSRSQLYRKTKALTGLSVNAFIRKIRLEESRKMLSTGNRNISEICYTVGFSSPSYFSKCFKDHFGVLPTEIQGTE